MRRSALAALVAGLVMAGPEAGGAQELSPVGCWSLQVGEWEPPLEGHDPGFPPPPWFELRGRRGGREGPAIYGGEWPGRERHWKWSRLRRGGVAIVFSAGFAGYQLRFEPRGDRLEGTIEAFSDVHRRARAPAVAIRTACTR